MWVCWGYCSKFFGSVTNKEVADKLAEQGIKVRMIERRNHIGGNCYDCNDEHGILIHQYGPHIFHTYSKEVYDFLSQYTKWYDYSHEVVGNVYDKIIPIPFNLNTLNIVYKKTYNKDNIWRRKRKCTKKRISGYLWNGSTCTNSRITKE